MPRNAPPAIIQDLKSAAKTMCSVLKITPRAAPAFGLCSTNMDVVYDDGKGPVTYRAKKGYTPSDVTTRADLTVDNGEAHGLLAMYPLDGVTQEAIARGDYDGASFAQYLINYAAPDHGHIQLNGGTIGQITSLDDLAIAIELRSLTQTLKQNSVIELTSITCRAKFGDERCKMPFVWKAAIVTSVGAEADRTFGVIWVSDAADAQMEYVPPASSDDGRDRYQLLSDAESSSVPVTSLYSIADVKVDGSSISDWIDEGNGIVSIEPVYLQSSSSEPVVTWSGTYGDESADYPGGFIAPGIAHWESGDNIYQENEVEEIASKEVSLVIATRKDIQVGDTLRIRRDCDKSKAMCKDYGNILNMRAEPEIPRADGNDLQAPTPK